VFIKAYIKKNIAIKEKHQSLLFQANVIFNQNTRDCSKKLSTLISSIFPNNEGFDVNYKSLVLEGNTLSTMAARLFTHMYMYIYIIFPYR
jgi:hypothetical protein